METANKTSITVETTVNAPIEKVWKYWNQPEHITKWNNASDDWHSPYSENDLRTNGTFKTTMAAKDGSMSFDFEGKYNKVNENQLIEYTMTDGRKVHIQFLKAADGIKVIETFEAEESNPIKMQKEGWQSILDNFKKYTEAH